MRMRLTPSAGAAAPLFRVRFLDQRSVGLRVSGAVAPSAMPACDGISPADLLHLAHPERAARAGLPKFWAVPRRVAQIVRGRRQHLCLTCCGSAMASESWIRWLHRGVGCCCPRGHHGRARACARPVPAPSARMRPVAWSSACRAPRKNSGTERLLRPGQIGPHVATLLGRAAPEPRQPTEPLTRRNRPETA